MGSAMAHAEVGAPGSKGLRSNALGFVSNTVIGVASTAPAYSLAVSLGLVAGYVGLASPAIMVISFVPMLFIAASYYYLNRADPDCGTSFSWVTRAMGPIPGWMTGWAIIVADIVVMASLAEIAAVYTFQLFGIDTSTWGTVSLLGQEIALSTAGTMALGIAFIVLLTWIVYVGIEVSARTQVVLLSMELIALAIFAGGALIKVASGSFADSVTPSLDWINPFSITDWSSLTAAVMVALFIYWGWDTAAAVNEETKDSSITPGRGAVVSTLILVGTYVLVTVAAQAVHGAEFLAAKGEEDVLGALANGVLGSPLDKLVILAVLTSAAASTQTTILPTARTALSMGAKRALPAYWARTHERFMTPTTATVWMGILSIAWYVGLKMVSENLFNDAVLSLGLMIAFYYGLTGYACAIYYRHRLTQSLSNFLMMGVVPLLGGIMLTAAFVKSVIDLADPANSYSEASWFGFGPPLVITVVLGAVGVVLMIAQWRYQPEFFHRPPEAAEPEPPAPLERPRLHPAGMG